jgi:hypothetical protein
MIRSEDGLCSVFSSFPLAGSLFFALVLDERVPAWTGDRVDAGKHDNTSSHLHDVVLENYFRISQLVQIGSSILPCKLRGGNFHPILALHSFLGFPRRNFDTLQQISRGMIYSFPHSPSKWQSK